MSKEQSLESWIKEAIFDPDKSGQCVAMSLIHMRGQFSEEIHSIKLNTGQQYTTQELAERFLHKARGYSQDLVGVQLFQLLAFYGNPEDENPPKEPGAKHPFRINVENNSDSLWTEGPTEAGKTQQNMRLTEALVQGSFRQNAYVFDTLMDTLRTFGHQNRQLMEQNHLAFQEMKNMAAAMWEKEKSLKEQEFEQREKGLLLSQAMKYLPALANTVTGKDVFPQTTVDSSIIDLLIEEIDEETIKKLQEVLPEKVMGLLTTRMVSTLEKRKKDSEVVKSSGLRVLEGRKAEDDAVGD